MGSNAAGHKLQRSTEEAKTRAAHAKMCGEGAM
jgi:hypothetical protein